MTFQIGVCRETFRLFGPFVEVMSHCLWRLFGPFVEVIWHCCTFLITQLSFKML